MGRTSHLLVRSTRWAGKHPTKTLLIILFLLTGAAWGMWRALNAIGWSVSFLGTLLVTALAVVVALIVIVSSMMAEEQKQQKQSP